MQHEQHAREAAPEAQKKPAAKERTADASATYKCGNCGAPHGAADKFCSECGYSLSSGSCSFCGGDMALADAYCPECGNPRSGIVCPGCGTLSFSNFCGKCNSPLNDTAREALAQARRDPALHRTLAVARELEELQQIIASFDAGAGGAGGARGAENAAPPELPELSAENRALLEQYRDLLTTFRGVEPPGPEPTPDTPKPEKTATPKPRFSIEIATREEAMEKYREAMGRMQEALSAMIPDAGATPQMQRDYHSARKPDVRRPGRVYWECEAYGCLHDTPNECSKPWKGGIWKYVPDEDIVITYGGPS